MNAPYICQTCHTDYDTYPEAMACFTAHRPVKLTGGSAGYYKVRVERPTSGGEPYTAECNDIIEALNMEYDVANAFKAAWRVAALRQGRGKPGQDSAVYDGEKIVFFGQRIIERAK
jgi:hypothetical protein